LAQVDRRLSENWSTFPRVDRLMQLAFFTSCHADARGGERFGRDSYRDFWPITSVAIFNISSWSGVEL